MIAQLILGIRQIRWERWLPLLGVFRVRCPIDNGYLNFVVSYDDNIFSKLKRGLFASSVKGHRQFRARQQSDTTPTSVRAYLIMKHITNRSAFSSNHLIVRGKPSLKPADRQGAVYEIKCCDCQAFYIVETGRNLSTRLTAQAVETSITVNNNSPIQDYVHPDDQTQPTAVLLCSFCSIYKKSGAPKCGICKWNPESEWWKQDRKWNP